MLIKTDYSVKYANNKKLGPLREARYRQVATR